MKDGVFLPDYAVGGTRSEHFDWWCAENLIQSVDQFAGKPLTLEEWQLRFFSEALSLDDQGDPYWRLVVLVVSRKNGKTAMLSAYSLYHLLEAEGSPEVLMAASSDKQAGRLFEASVAFVRRGEDLGSQLHLREYIGEIARVDGGGKIMRMASDPGRVHGYNPSLVIADELHAWTTPSLRKAWGAFISAGGARTARQIFAITTAGDAHEREDGILGALVDGNETKGELEKTPGLTVSRNHAAKVLVYNYSAPTLDREDVESLKLANPASWITLDYLREQAGSPAMSDAEVLQLHGCVWAVGKDQWIDPEKWSLCLEDDVEIPDRSDVYVAVDMSIREDCSAVAWAWRRPDGTVVVDAHVWGARFDVAADTYVRGDIDPRLIEEYIDGLASRFRVRNIVYDPALFARSGHELAERYEVAPLAQASRNMAEAYNMWFSAVNTQTVRHAGGDTLSAHVTNALAENTDRGWKLSKAKQSKKIDALVAAVMAHWQAAVNASPASVYEDRPMLAF